MHKERNFSEQADVCGGAERKETARAITARRDGTERRYWRNGTGRGHAYIKWGANILILDAGKG